MFPYPTQFGFGWRNDIEPPGLLSATALPSFSKPVKIPERIDPRPWMRIENQRQTSSCVGHALSTCIEALHFFEMGIKVELSRWQCYIASQKESGLVGRDQGAMISGAVTAAEKYGACREELCTFTGSYHTNVSDEAWKDAETRQVKRHVKINSFGEALDWLGGLIGTVIIGVPVGQRFQNCRGELDQVDASGGGHALAIIGYVTEGATKKLILFNSWDVQWGNQGTCLVTERAFDAWCAQARGGRSEVWGITNLEKPEPRWSDLWPME